MTINATGVPQGVYSLTLESIDSASDIKPEIALKTDTVTIYVTEYVRDKSIANYFVIPKGSNQKFSVEHVRPSITLPKPPKVGLRQKFGEELPYLPFVSFKNGASSTEIEIDTFRL